MREAAREKREAEIAEAAYALLAENGFTGFSMLAVAKRAKASNETLYRWYGDKPGLFRALIARNAALVGDRLDHVLAKGAVPSSAFSELGPLLLGMLLSPRAIALNRAAAADPTGSLGAVLAEAGRGSVYPRVVRLFEGLVTSGVLTGPAETDAALWLDLLVGDWQIRCATGQMPLPDAAAIAARADRAEALLRRVSDRRGL